MRICENCGGPLSDKAKYGVCWRNPDCIREQKRRSSKVIPSQSPEARHEEYLRHREHYLEYHKNLRQNDPIGQVLKNAKRRAEQTGVPFSLTGEFIPPIPSVCSILNIPLIPPSTVSDTKNPNIASLDKIVNHGVGYVPGNVQWISLRANLLKRDATLEELVLLGEWAAKQLVNHATIEINERIA